MKHSEIIHKLDALSGAVPIGADFQTATKSAAAVLTTLMQALADIHYKALLPLYDTYRHAGLAKQWALEVLDRHPEDARVSELYELDDFGLAIRALVDGFEYPDYCHKTVGEILQTYGKLGR